MTTRLVLLTYNIHGGIGVDGVLDLGRIAEVVEASGAQVVALQEVDRHLRAQSRHEDQAGLLADRLGMHLAYAVCVDRGPGRPGGPPRQYGTALLATMPLVGPSTTLLPCFAGSEQRGLLDATVQVDGRELRVLGTHLQWDREDERVEQARVVLDALDDRPTVLLGDLNTEPGSPTHRLLAQRLVDAWAEVGEGTGHTWENDEPHRRIDYVWCGGGVRPVAARVLPSVASDHAALRVEVELPG